MGKERRDEISKEGLSMRRRTIKMSEFNVAASHIEWVPGFAAEILFKQIQSITVQVELMARFLEKKEVR